MMMRFTALFLLLLTLYSCEKDKIQPPVAPQPSFIPISSTLHPLLFDTSSYWIYSNGNILDTVSLSAITRVEMFVPPQQTKDETFLLQYESSAFSSYTERYMGAIITRNWINEGWAYATNFEVGESYGGLTLIGKLDTLTVGTHQYYNVTQFKVQQSNYFSSDMYLYYADSVGVISKEILSGNSVVDTWNLIEYNVAIYPY